MSRDETLTRMASLIMEHRWAALATVDTQGIPVASMVAYAVDSTRGELLLHLSKLAAHTGNLLAHGKGAITIGENDPGDGDPQQLARVSINGEVSVIGREDTDYESARAVYLRRLPASAQLFEFPDFILFRLVPDCARFVGGFGQARSFGANDVRSILRDDAQHTAGCM